MSPTPARPRSRSSPNSLVEWLVPSHSTQLTGVADGTVPVNADLGTLYGDPDIFGVNPSPTVTVPTVRGAELGGVPWAMYIQQTGPFPATGAPSGTADAGLVAHTRLFDDAVTTSTGDVWEQTVDPAGAYTPLVLAPGEAGTIDITFDATGPAGTHVNGTIDIDTFSDLTGSGDALATIPYAYTTS